MDRVLIVGLDDPEVNDLRKSLPGKCVFADMLPRLLLDRGRLHVENPNVFDTFVPVSRVVYHGIFEDDLPFLSALALWGGPCLPNARGMMDCRQRLPGLVRALAVSRFGALPRGFADRETIYPGGEPTVAKWGEWHCGENKERFAGTWKASVPTLFEPLIAGEAVRLHLTGDRSWQMRMGGADWKKSIHHESAAFMEVDAELLEDTRRLQSHFGLEMLAVDYMIGTDGKKYLLEVNHIPNMTIFPEVRAAYLDLVVQWVAKTAIFTA